MDEYYKDLTLSVLQAGTAKLIQAEGYLKRAGLPWYQLQRISRIINSVKNLTTEIRDISNNEYFNDPDGYIQNAKD